MNNAPVISIVTPSYNQGKFLAETIQSVLSQDGDFSLDYIIVDGGSTDQSLDIIRQFADRIDSGEFRARCNGLNYRWQSARDQGQADALRNGFQLAKGDIIAWLNSDDTLQPQALQKISAFFAQNRSIAMVYGNACYCDQHGTIIGTYPAEAFSLAKLSYFNFVPQPATFFRRSAYESVGGINASLTYAMDYDLWIRIGKRLPCSHLPQCLASYRLHDDAKTVRDATLYDNHKEGLAVVMTHFGWAPLNLVYGVCQYWWRLRLPKALIQHRLVLIALSTFCTIFRSLYLNRGVDWRDLQLFTLANFRKLFKDRRSIILGD